jgi:shikimate dehydrogenase
MHSQNRDPAKSARTAAHRAGVLGYPIGHSLSPALYRAGFAALGMGDWSFDALECDAARLPGLVGDLGPEWAGLAVTMPGKAAAAAFAGARSDRVRALGVANTLVKSDGGWWAENTDVDGVRGSLAAAGVPPAGRVLLIGGGGTARAVVAALAELHWDGQLILAGRRPESTAAVGELATALGLAASRTGMTADLVADVAEGLELAISTVPAGAADHLAPVLAGVPALVDVIYHPWPTPLAAAGAPGRTTVTGLDMLLHQALTQFELITGVEAPADALRDALRSAVGSDLPLPV